MSLIVISYPKINRQDFEWIQSIRKKYDELYFNVIKPHFTFIFPVESADDKKIISHLKKMITRQHEIEFNLSKTIINKDVFNNYWHIFLVPAKGEKEIMKLHDKLYTGILAPELRKDIPFIPHLGIANGKNKNKCLALEKRLSKNTISINGKINEINICRYENNKITTITKIRLKLIMKHEK